MSETSWCNACGREAVKAYLCVECGKDDLVCDCDVLPVGNPEATE